MNVGRFIRQAKSKFSHMRAQNMENKKIVAAKENKRKADELAELRKERLRLEGQAKLEKLRQHEKSRIEKAKAARPNKLKSFGRGLAKVINKGSEGIKAAKKAGFLKGNDFTGGGSKNPFGGGSSSNSPFGMSSKPKGQMRAKKKVVTYYE